MNERREMAAQFPFGASFSQVGDAAARVRARSGSRTGPGPFGRLMDAWDTKDVVP